MLMEKAKNILLLVFCVAVVLSIGYVSGSATRASLNDWYPTINKPSFNPPNNIFAPVWTVLYLLMAVGIYLVLKQPVSVERTMGALTFIAQLLLNFLWSFIFFRYHQIGWAFIEIIFLWAAILLMIVEFKKVNAVAAYLQIPYLLWVTFAAILNAAMWQLN